MRRNRITSEFIRILDIHTSLKRKTDKPFQGEWINGEISGGSWFEPVHAGDVIDRLIDLFDVFNELANTNFADHSIERDQIESELIDTDQIAYYESFRKAANFDSNSDWGVFLNLYEFFFFNRRIAIISKTSQRDSIPHTWKFILHHELNHYEIDLAILLIEIVSGQSLYNSQISVPEEEGLGNGRGIFESRISEPWKTSIVDLYQSGHLKGYKDIGKYLTPAEIRQGFERVLEIYLGMMPGKLPGYTNLLMNPKLGFKSKDVPITLVNNIQKKFTNETFSAISSFTILAISESTKAQKRYEKLAKRDPRMAKQYKKKIRQYLESPDLPGHRIRSFQGEKDLIEARIDGGFRVLLRDLGHGNWKVEDLGPDLYSH